MAKNTPTYPMRLYLFNLALNFFLRYCYLWIPGAILCLAGIRVQFCLALGLAFLFGDLAVSVIDQVRARRASLLDPQDDDYVAMMDAALGAGGPDEFRKIIQGKLTRKEAPGTDLPAQKREAAEEPAIHHPYE